MPIAEPPEKTDEPTVPAAGPEKQERPQELPPHVYIAVELLMPAAYNPRFLTNVAADEELARNIAAVGVKQPLLARPHPKHKGKFEVVAGSRRLKATLAAKLATAPVIVQEMNDAEARELNILENMQRVDLHPLERARGVHELIELGWPIDRIARRMGLSTKQIRRIARIEKLDPCWKNEIMKDGSPVSLWDQSCLETIAALPADLQPKVFKELHSFRWNDRHARPTRTELEEWMARNFTFELAAAPWPKDHPTLNAQAGPCTTCPHRTGADPLLWDVETPAGKPVHKDRCLRPSCYQEKSAKFVEINIRDLHKEFPKVMVTQGDAHLSYSEEQKLEKRHGSDFISEHVLHYKKVSTKPTKGSVPVVDIAGQLAGRTRYLIPEKPEKPKKNGSAGDAPAPLAERRKILAMRRKAYVVEQIRNRTEKFAAANEVPGVLVEAGVSQVISLAAAFGTRSNALNEEAGKVWKRWEKLKALPTHELKAELYRPVLNLLADRLCNTMGTTGHHVNSLYGEAERIAQLTGIDLNELVQEAEDAIKEPAGWKKLNADGSPKGVADSRESKKSAKAKN